MIRMAWVNLMSNVYLSSLDYASITVPNLCTFRTSKCVPKHEDHTSY